jgi:hypothetical protein
MRPAVAGVIQNSTWRGAAGGVVNFSSLVSAFYKKLVAGVLGSGSGGFKEEVSGGWRGGGHRLSVHLSLTFMLMNVCNNGET